MRKTHHIEYYPGVSQATGGVIVCVKRTIISLCGMPKSVVLDVGRVTSLRFDSGDQKLGIIGVHIDPGYTLDRKKKIIAAIYSEMQSDKGVLWIICGDFNFESIGEKSYNAKRGEFMISSTSECLSMTWSSLMGNLIEHSQPDFTRAQNGPEGISLSRIDRIYSSTPSWRLWDLEIRTATVGQVTSADRLSDHVPVVSFMCARRRRSGQTPLPVWTSKDPFYEKALDQEMKRCNIQSLPIVEAVQKLKECMRKASKAVSTKSMLRGAGTIEEKVFWAITCARALFHGMANRVVDSIVAYPHLEKFVLLDYEDEVMLIQDLHGLDLHIAELMRETIDKARAQYEHTCDLPEYRRAPKRNAFNRLMDLWATRNRKAPLQAARDSNGGIVKDPAQAASMYIDHWKKVAETKKVDSEKARAFLKQYMHKLPEFKTVVSFERFLEVVRALGDSACGPDGIPYAAWANAPDSAIYILYRLYCSLFVKGNVAEDFNHSWLVLLAKGEQLSDPQLVARSPDDTRPISLSNSDSKICETALNIPLAESLEQWGDSDQRGFIGGRMIVDNVIELDTYGRIVAMQAGVASSTSESVHGKVGECLPALAFFDFAAAFPSVAWAYLWLCMHFAGLPRPYIRAFKKVYRCNVHFLRFMGRVFQAYVNASGVKTGGTASGSIFVLCIDPFLRMLRDRCSPRDLGRAFADDIGYVMIDIRITLPLFVICFQLFAEVSNVRLKIKKTIIVPMWRCRLDDARRIISNIVPEWSGVQVAFSAKYLGVHLGPRSAELMWTSALEKYESRVQVARGTGAGLFSAIMEYNTMCINTLSYLWQFSLAGPRVLATEARMLQRMVGCPRYTFTKECMWSLDTIGMAKAFKSIRICNIAAMVRLALQTATTFKEMTLRWDEALLDDSSPMLGLVTRDFDLFDSPAIINQLQKAVDHAFLPDLHVPAWKGFSGSIRRASGDGSLQKQVAMFLRDCAFSFDAAGYLTRRMARWHACVSDDAKSWWGMSGVLLIELCTTTLMSAPQCVVAACLKTALNGWSTTRRLKDFPTRCQFGCGKRSDCIEHYLQCARLETIWERLYKSEWGSFECRLAFGDGDIASKIVRAYFLYGAMTTYNHLRHHAGVHDSDFYFNMVRAKIAYAIGRSPAHLRNNFNPSIRVRPRDTLPTCSVEQVGEVIFNFRKRQILDLKSSDGRKRKLNSGPKRCKPTKRQM